MRIVVLMALAIVAMASIAAADTVGPSVDGCVELFAGMDESGAVSIQELCSKLASALGLEAQSTRVPKEWASTYPQAGLLTDAGVLRALRELLSLPCVAVLKSFGGGPEGKAALEAFDICEVLSELGDLPARLVRALLAAEPTKASIQKFFSAIKTSKPASLVDPVVVALGETTTTIEFDPAAAEEIATILTRPATADDIVGLGAALGDCDTLQPMADGIKAAVLGQPVPQEAVSEFDAQLIAVLTPAIKNQAARDALAHLLTSLSPQLLPLLLKGGAYFDNMQEQVPDQLKPFRAAIEALFSSTEVAALLGAVIRAPAAADALLLILSGDMTGDKFTEAILPELIKTRSIFKAVADVLRDDAVATLIHDITDAAFQSDAIEDKDKWDTFPLSTIRTVLQSRFLLNRIAGLIETTPLGAEIAMIWMKPDVEAMDCATETAKVLSIATANAAADLVTGTASAAMNAAMDGVKNIADDPAAAAAEAAGKAKAAANAAKEAAAAAWGSFSSWYSSDDVVETKDDL